jgi:hypothetical protein
MAKDDYDNVIAWVTKNYSPEDFGISEDDLKEKLIEDGRYDLSEETELIVDTMLQENENFSPLLFQKAFTKDYLIRNFVTPNFDTLKKEAERERQRIKREERIEALRQNPGLAF